MTWDIDREFEDRLLTGVEKQGDGYVLNTGGWSLFVEDPGFAPEAGDTVRYFGRGLGHTVRGVVVFPRQGGMPLVVHYETAEDERIRHQRELEEKQAKDDAAAIAERPDRDARIAALPVHLRVRFAAFTKANPHFARDYETYELFVCEEAAKIAAALTAAGEGTGEAVQSFARLGWQQQLEKVPGLSDGHSGNTFGMACRLAYHLLTVPANAAREHGAMATLVGCKAYGCEHEDAR